MVICAADLDTEELKRAVSALKAGHHARYLTILDRDDSPESLFFQRLLEPRQESIMLYRLKPVLQLRSNRLLGPTLS